MELKEYEHHAILTDQTRKNADTEPSRDIVIALLGLSGEVGTLSTAYKKFLRDGKAYELYRENIREELGDILWYTAILANKCDLTLDEVASHNIRKVRERWGPIPIASSDFIYLDQDFPLHEQFPRFFEVLFEEKEINNHIKLVLTINGKDYGDALTDNSYGDDGYRFHDVFHFAYVAILGWSPITRKLLNIKRKSIDVVDEVEDGGRAGVIEEGISAFIFDYASKHNYLDGVKRIDFEILKVVKDLTTYLEVSARTFSEWEEAIIEGFRVFRELKRLRGGFVIVDMQNKTIRYKTNIRHAT